MKKLFILGILLSTHLPAETITGKIHSIEKGLLKFENGRVAFLDSKEVPLSPGAYVEAKINGRSSLLSYKQLKAPEENELKNTFFFPEETTPPAFEPTVVSGMEEAWSIFNRSNPYYKRVSECTDRAHVWAHEEFGHSGTKSMKAFVFFTASYINSVRFKWWFHVAPMYKVNDGGTVKDLVMDYRYTDRPMSVKEWTDQFVYTKRPCKVTTKFSEYDVNPQTENCYLIYESMHYKIPGEIHKQETEGRYKTTTSESEVKAAFRFGFEQQQGVSL